MVKTEATLNNVGCEQETDKEGKVVFQKDGKTPKYRIAYKYPRKVKLGAKEMEVEEIETMTSLVQVPLGLVRVEMNQFCIVDERTKQAKLINQVKSVVEISKPKAKAE